MNGDKTLPKYQVPEVVTYTEEEILEELGPALASYGDGVPGSKPLPPIPAG
jgi:hypothetical protein